MQAGPEVVLTLQQITKSPGLLVTGWTKDCPCGSFSACVFHIDVTNSFPTQKKREKESPGLQAQVPGTY